MNHRKNRLRALCTLASLSLGLLALSGCKDQPKAPTARAFPVTVEKVVKEDYPVTLPAVGQMVSPQVVDIYPQVAGQLVKIYFKEGQTVQTGDLLFSIDDRSFKADLEQAKAALAKSVADFRYTSEQVKRYTNLVEKDYISQSNFDDLVTRMEGAKADIQAKRAAVDLAQVNLGYCTIHAPISGVIGVQQVTEGNIVQPGMPSSLAVIRQISPIYNQFSISERYFPKVQEYLEKGSLPVQVKVPDSGEEVQKGTLSFVDNTINPQTGMINLRAVFENEKKLLWPGQYTETNLTIANWPGAIVVPTEAVIISATGDRIVFILNADNTVTPQVVEVALTENDITIVKKGLDGTETVVTKGQINLKSGTKVQVQDGSQS